MFFKQMDRLLRVAGLEGRLAEYIKDWPKDKWDITVLFAACLSDGNLNVLKSLIAHGLDVNTPIEPQGSLLHVASLRNQVSTVELLIAAGAKITSFDSDGITPLQICMKNEFFSAIANTTARTLIANGARISTMKYTWTWLGSISMHKQEVVEDELRLFEKQIDKCRAAVVALLRIKDVGKLWRWDRFLLAHISHTVWATRTDEIWEN